MRTVIQTAFGDSGHTTFFVRNADDYRKYAREIEAEAEVKIMKRIRCRGSALEACVTRHGTIVGPLMTELVGFKELTPYRGGWCGNEVVADAFSRTVRERARESTFRFGEALRKRGYRGYFECDYLYDLDSDDVYLGEINPRITGASSMTNLAAFAHADAPLFLFHLLEWAADWSARCRRLSPEYEAWFLKEGDGRRPGYLTSRRALAEHMPELVPTWERLTDLAGGGDRAARLLSLYCPTPYLVACSQALWTRGEPWLVRNYDYHPAQCEGTILHSCWRGTRVIASTDSLWGVLDGMNDRGLAVTLAFGGRPAVGPGFAITLILRYVLEVCQSVDEAIAVLRRVPSHMVYTVGLVDRTARHATAYVAPDRPTEVSDARVSTNHQHRGEWPDYTNLTRSEARATALQAALEAPGMTPERLLEVCRRPPVASDDWARAFGTLYTAAYRPFTGRIHYRWPSSSWDASFDHFTETTTVVRYGLADRMDA